MAGELKVLAVQQDMSVHLSRGCEPVGAAMSSSSGGGDAGVAALLPDEGVAPQRARGALSLTRQCGCFQCETAGKGCQIPLFIVSCVSGEGAFLSPGSWVHPAHQPPSAPRGEDGHGGPAAAGGRAEPRLPVPCPLAPPCPGGVAPKPDLLPALGSPRKPPALRQLLC